MCQFIYPLIQIGVVIRKRSNQSQILNFAASATLKFDWWPRQIIWQHFHTTSSTVHNFVTICEFKLELQSRNTHFGTKSSIFRPVWPSNLTDAKIIGHFPYVTSIFLHDFVDICEFKLAVTVQKRSIRVKIVGQNRGLSGPCDLEIRRMTLQTYRTHRSCHCEMFVSFHDHL